MEYQSFTVSFGIIALESSKSKEYSDYTRNNLQELTFTIITSTVPHCTTALKWNGTSTNV